MIGNYILVIVCLSGKEVYFKSTCKPVCQFLCIALKGIKLIKQSTHEKKELTPGIYVSRFE